jgi:hypothetical protein
MYLDHSTWLTALSFAAGGINAVSTIPQLVAALRGNQASPSNSSKDGQQLRNFAQTVGNSLWVIFGCITGNIAITIFCGINTVLVGTLLIRSLLPLDRSSVS